MTIRRVGILLAALTLGALAAWSQPITPGALPSEGSCPPQANVACSAVNFFYSVNFTVSNPPVGAGSATWSISAGLLPPGLAIVDTSTNIISYGGTLTTPGLYTFTLKATYATVPSPTVFSQQYSLAVFGPALTITGPLSLPTGMTVGTAITPTTIVASGGVPFIDSKGNGSYHWAIVPGSQPDGLTIDPNLGILSGTPTYASTFTITIGVIDAVGQTTTHIYQFTVGGTNSITITTASPLPAGVINQAYSQNLAQTGGPSNTGTVVCPTTNDGIVCWSIVSGNLPAGLNIATNADGSATIGGTPTAAGTFNFTVQAGFEFTNALGVVSVTGTKAFSVTITGQLTMANPAPVSGFVNQQLPTMQFTASGGTPPYTYALLSGTLPPGVSPNAQTGAVTGTPTQAGTFTFTIQVTDSARQTATAQGTITVTALTFSPTITPGGTVTPATQPPVTVSVGSGAGIALNGTLVLTFANSINGSDNPEVAYSDGTRSVAFTVAAGGAVTLPAGLSILTGTVAGTGSLVATFKDSLGNVLLTTMPTTFTVPPTVPVISSFSIVCTPASTTGPAFYTATVVGFSSTLDVTGVTFNFTPTTGTALASSSVTLAQSTVQPAFAAWYANAASDATGSQFTLTVHLSFTVTGGASTNPIDTATATVTNARGNSTASPPASPPGTGCS